MMENRLLVGSKQEFAFDVEVLSIVDKKIFGNFSIWLNNEIIGDPEDLCCISHCLNWINELILNPDAIDRYDPGVWNMTDDQIFSNLYDPYMFYKATKAEPTIIVKEPQRFNITQIGMSSLENFPILLIERLEKEKLVLYSYLEDRFKSHIIPKGTVAIQSALLLKIFSNNITKFA